VELWAALFNNQPHACMSSAERVAPPSLVLQLMHACHLLSVLHHQALYCSSCMRQNAVLVGALRRRPSG
jgi:hypothetical protein